MSLKNTQPGSALIAVIIFAGVFLMSIGAVINLLIVEQRTAQRRVASEEAFQIAEAGLNRYRWILAHDPNDYDGVDADYVNSEGETIGHYTVTIDPPVSGSSTVTITSTGWTSEYPNVKRYVQARYGKPSYAKFAFLANNNIWFGSTEAVHGRLHSNGGIRMDGTVDSLTTSIKETYICGQEHDCEDEEKPGIWGTGTDQSLWDFPIADAIDFDVVTVDLQTMYDAAADAGVLLENSDDYGYHIVFHSDGTFSVYDVTRLQNAVWGHDGTNWTNESNAIRRERLKSGYDHVPLPDNGIIFVEDQTWVSGEVNGRITVAAAQLPEGSGTPYDIIIHDDITYFPERGSGSVLGLIAQQDILVDLYSPDNLVIDAALMAQNGHVFRYYYYPSYYPDDTIKSYIETYGTIITNTTWTWSWVDGDGLILSGYEETESIYDPDLLYAPPPFFPTTDDYEFISWEEVLASEVN